MIIKINTIKIKQINFRKYLSFLDVHIGTTYFISNILSTITVE